MAKCWRFVGQGVGNDSYYEYFACGDVPEYRFNGTGYNLYIDGRNLGGSGYEYRSGTQQVSEVPRSTPTSGFHTFGSCSGCEDPLPKTYDCINGSCIESTQYKTPGLYKSLEECQSKCGTMAAGCPPGEECLDPKNYCPPGHVCLTSSEFSEISSLASQIKGEICE